MLHPKKRCHIQPATESTITLSEALLTPTSVGLEAVKKKRKSSNAQRGVVRYIISATPPCEQGDWCLQCSIKSQHHTT